ncbi:MAG TPA: hypothetical protein VFI22_19125 [Thermomicrobiales bacterium]|nr:hypothetical protein [Thermomicrobiales bacterium]
MDWFPGDLLVLVAVVIVVVIVVVVVVVPMVVVVIAATKRNHREDRIEHWKHGSFSSTTSGQLPASSDTPGSAIWIGFPAALRCRQD